MLCDSLGTSEDNSIEQTISKAVLVSLRVDLVLTAVICKQLLLWASRPDGNLIMKLHCSLSMREGERFSTSIQPAWPMRTGLCSCLSLLQVHEAGIKGTLGDAGIVDEVALGEEVMDRGLARSEACLNRAAQLMLLRPINMMMGS